MSLLKVDQAWKSLRTEPRFAAVVRPIGIPYLLPRRPVIL